MDVYMTYIEMFGRVRSGHQVAPSDFGTYRVDGDWREYSTERRIAVSLASQDAKAGVAMRTKSEISQEIARLLAE